MRTTGDLPRRLRFAALVTIACLLAGAPAHAADTQAPVDTRTVCFEVHNGLGRARVVGTRFASSTSDPDRVILLVHGHSVTGQFWDLLPDYSVARNLARAGYVVIAYDRLSFGRSTYVLPATVTFDADREMISEIVEQLRHTYPLPATGPLGACPAGESPGVGRHPRVVLVGHSLGGGLVSGYAGQYGALAPVDALVQVDWSDVGGSSPTEAIFAGGFSPYAGNVIMDRAFSPKNIGRWATLFLDDGSTPSHRTISTTCCDPSGNHVSTCQQDMNLALYPGMPTRPRLSAGICDPSNYQAVPYSSFISDVVAGDENKHLVPRTDPKLPVLLVWGDHDAIFPPGPSQTAEDALWRSRGGDLTIWTEQDTGHAFVRSLTMPDFTGEVASWLHAHGM